MSFNALLIHARKIAVFIPMLTSLEKDCRGNISLMIERVDSLFPKDDTETRAINNQIVHWLKFLYDCGEHVADWNINYISWLEIDDEVKEAYPDASSNELLRIQMGIFTMQRQRVLNWYKAERAHNKWV